MAKITAKLRTFGKTSPPVSEYDPGETLAARKAVNTKELCTYCNERYRAGTDRLCAPCGHRAYMWGTSDPKFRSPRLEEIMEELILVKSIIRKNAAAPGTILALKFFETIMTDSQKLSTIHDLSERTTAWVKRWAEKGVAPLDLLVVSAAIVLNYYSNKGRILSDRNLHYVIGNLLIRMVSTRKNPTGLDKRTIGALVHRQVGAYTITVAKTGIEYMKQKETEQIAMIQPLEAPDATLE